MPRHIADAKSEHEVLMKTRRIALPDEGLRCDERIRSELGIGAGTSRGWRYSCDSCSKIRMIVELTAVDTK